MKDYKLMSAPMFNNLKKVTSSYSGLVDPTLYKHLIFGQHYIIYMFCSERLE